MPLDVNVTTLSGLEPVSYNSPKPKHPNNYIHNPCDIARSISAECMEEDLV